MENTFKKALEFASRKHAGQKRTTGDNYIIHPIRVSQGVFTPTQKVIALLHDTVEDTGTTLEEIELNFGEDVAVAVDALTHRKGESYADYIQRVKNNEDAIAVKLADIADNLNDSPSENAIRKSSHGLNELLS